MDPEPGKPQPRAKSRARRILEKLLADETIPERQDLEGLKIPISKLVKVHLDRAFWLENQNLPCRFLQLEILGRRCGRSVLCGQEVLALALTN